MVAMKILHELMGDMPSEFVNLPKCRSHVDLCLTVAGIEITAAGWRVYVKLYGEEAAGQRSWRFA